MHHALMILGLILLFGGPTACSSWASSTDIDDRAVQLELCADGVPEITEVLQGRHVDLSSITNHLRFGRWLFYEDSTLRFGALTGSYRRSSDRLDFDVQTDGVSLDGRLHLRDAYEMDAVYAAIGRPQRVVRVSQKLTSRCTEAREDLANLETEPRVQPASTQLDHDELEEGYEDQTAATESSLATPSLLMMDQVALETQIYHVFFTGRTDVGEFGPLPGYLFISRAAANGELSAFSLLGNPDDAHVHDNGFIHLVHDEESGSTDSGIRVKNDGQSVHVEVVPSDEFGRQYGLGSEAHPASAVIHTGTVSFSISGEQVEGHLRFSGFRIPYGMDEYSYESPSFCEAKFVGAIPRSEIVERLKKDLTLPFHGVWRIAGLEGDQMVELMQDGDRVQGRFQGDGVRELQGIASGRRLDFHWTDTEAAHDGGGFLRILPSGTLVGLLHARPGAIDSGRTILGRWAIPNYVTDHPLTVFDFDELKSFLDGEDERRCEQIATLLEHGDRALASSVDDSSEASLASAVELDRRNTDRLIAAFSRNYEVLRCRFELGDYPEFLAALDRALDVATQLGPEQAAARLFRMLVEEPVSHLEERLSSLDMILSYYKGLRDALDPGAGRVGIQLAEPTSEGQVPIAAVAEDMPAKRVGLKTGDLILAIDGEPVAPTLSEALEQLSGAPGTTAILSVRREGVDHDFSVTRETSADLPPRRRQQVKAACAALAEDVGRTHRASKDFLGRWRRTIDEVAKGADPVQRIMRLPRELSKLSAAYEALSNQALREARRLFAKTAALPHLVTLDEMMREVEKMTGGSLAHSKDMAQAEQIMVSLIASEAGLEELEKHLFRSLFMLLVMARSDATILQMAAQQVERYDHRRLFKENRRQAIESAERIAPRFENWLSKVERDVDRIDSLDTAQTVLRKATELLLSLNEVERALVTTERSRARALLELMGQQEERPPNDEIVGGGATSIELEDLRQVAMTHKATLIEYTVLSRDILQIWVVQPDGAIRAASVDLAEKKLSHDKVEDLVTVSARSLASARSRAVSRRPTGRPRGVARVESGPSDKETLRRLHQLLVEPIARWLPQDPSSQVVFIPHDYLYFVPYPALVDDNGSFLIEKHTMQTAPSIKVLGLARELRERRRSSKVDGGQVFVVGNPRMPIGLSPLPGAAKEADEVASLLDAVALKGPEATVDVVKAKLPQADLIHLATHGTFERTRADEPGRDGIPGALAFAPQGQKDGWLTATEISQMDLKADLVVLSACHTGTGRLSSDGVIGLARSFISAGVPSVVVSLWAIPDMPTSYLMSEFYRAWRGRGTSKAQALREAMLATLRHEEYRYPANWAAFTLIGDDR